MVHGYRDKYGLLFSGKGLCKLIDLILISTGGMIILYALCAIYVPNLKEPPRCRCGLMKGDGKGVLHRGMVHKTCDGAHKEDWESRFSDIDEAIRYWNRMDDKNLNAW